MSGMELVLEMQDARPTYEEVMLPSVLYNLRLYAGQCMVIETRSMKSSAAFANLCSGMVELQQGHIHFMGLDWAKLKLQQKNALRGRIGRLPQQGAWVNALGTHINIILQQMHHTRLPMDKIITEATKLSRRFGLPGLPVEAPEYLQDLDRARAACVRAFIGKPALLLLEYAVEDDHNALREPFFRTLSTALYNGAAAICFTKSRRNWISDENGGTTFYRLQDEGLLPLKGAF